MPIEVEMKLKLLEKQKILERMRKQGFALKSDLEMEDIYFSHPSRDFSKSDEALRLRKFIGEEKTEITYKGRKLMEKSKTREEITAKIFDGAELQRILSLLSFEEVGRIKKVRENWEANEVIISIDEVGGLGTYLEIECIVERNTEIKSAIQKLRKILENLGLDYRMEIRKSYIELLLDNVSGVKL